MSVELVSFKHLQSLFAEIRLAHFLEDGQIRYLFFLSNCQKVRYLFCEPSVCILICILQRKFRWENWLLLLPLKPLHWSTNVLKRKKANHGKEVSSSINCAFVMHVSIIFSIDYFCGVTNLFVLFTHPLTNKRV